MLSLRHITKTYNEKIVLDDISLAINPGEVIALIGENGAGKTTLLRILLGKVAPDEGAVHLHDEVVGYVPQEPEHQESMVSDSFSNCEQWRIDYALSLVKLGDVNQKVIKELSGGQKTRLAIAQVLALDPGPTVLLLDEPTNNIDSEGLEWLRELITHFTGVILLVSHDRSFINDVATSVVELSKGVLNQYGGNYDFYKEQKEIEYQAQLEEFERSEQKRRQLERVLREKQDRARKGLRNQKMRDNDKAQFDWHQNNVQRSFSGQARAMQTRLEQLEEVKRPESEKYYALTLTGGKTHDRKLLEVTNLHKSMGDNEVLQEVSLTIRGGERWYIHGLNGSGKTTLLSILAGRLKPDSGEMKTAERLSIGYFSQDVQELPVDVIARTVIEGTGAKSTDLYRQAKSMGLSQRDLAKRVGELSRGQQAKLQFSQLLLANHDVLILDEPTNHLDINTKERLEAALNNYHGALIVASHDKYFIGQIHTTNSYKL